MAVKPILVAPLSPGSSDEVVHNPKINPRQVARHHRKEGLTLVPPPAKWPLPTGDILGGRATNGWPTINATWLVTGPKRAEWPRKTGQESYTCARPWWL